MTTSSIIDCYTCHQPTTDRDAHQVRLFTPTGRFRNGHEILSTSRLVHECNDCFAASPDEDLHIYTVHTCGTTRTVSAATPEAAAVLMLQDRGWASTRSIAVIGSDVQCEYLNCELVDGALQYSERVDLP
jgi:hypothetical protein